MNSPIVGLWWEIYVERTDVDTQLISRLISVGEIPI